MISEDVLRHLTFTSMVGSLRADCIPSNRRIQVK
jgi:hypothetical protein